MGCLKLAYYKSVELDYLRSKTCLTSIKSEKTTYRSYIYQFSGKEVDNEVNGDGNSYDYGFRIYNPRLGRFLSVDPLFQTFAYYTPYQFSGNMPIWANDIDGLEENKTNGTGDAATNANDNAESQNDACSESQCANPTKEIATNKATLNVTPNNETNVVIDPGHGGVDPGAVNPEKGKRNEEDITLIVSKFVDERLQDTYCIDACVTRDYDVNPGNSQKERLAWRVDYADNVDADIFISIHVNSAENKNANYLSVIFQTKTTKSTQLAKSIAEELEGVAVGSSVKVHGQNIHVLREQGDNVQAVLVEIGFITNPEQATSFENNDKLKTIGYAIADGIFSTIQNQKINPATVND